MEAKRPYHFEQACSSGKSGDVLAVDVASQKVAGAAKTVADLEMLPLLDANGRICGTSLKSRINLPPFANSAMDGYAINREALSGSGPWRLPISDRIIAGDRRCTSLLPGTAIRIMTGASIPSGADCVVMQEYCDRQGDLVIVHERPPIGKHIRQPGEDLGIGTCLVEDGELLTPRHLALLAACGLAEVGVRRKVRIGLLSTGSELVEPGSSLSAGQIYNSNRTYLLSRLNRPWIETIDFGILLDNPSEIRGALRRAADACDVVITTGGVSVGEEDYMLDVLKREQAELEVLKVAMRPGKPVTAGRLGSAMYFGLPGNPYACAITFMQIAWPAIRKTGGLVPRESNHTAAVANFQYSRKPGRTEYLPVSWNYSDDSGRPIVEQLGQGASAGLHPFALARAIVALPTDVSEINPGDILSMEPVDF